MKRGNFDFGGVRSFWVNGGELRALWEMIGSKVGTLNFRGYVEEFCGFCWGCVEMHGA